MTEQPVADELYNCAKEVSTRKTLVKRKCLKDMTKQTDVIDS